MKNKADDLRNHLFAQLERLGDESLEGEALAAEINRAKAVQGIAGSVIGLAKEETNRARLVSDLGHGSGSTFMGETEKAALEGPKE